MAKSDKKQGVFSQIILAVVVALLVGGTAPWWFNEFFNKNDSHKPLSVTDRNSPVKDHPALPPSASPATKPSNQETEMPNIKSGSNQNSSNHSNIINISGDNNNVKIDNRKVSINYADNELIANQVNDALKRNFSDLNERMDYLKTEISMLHEKFQDGYYKDLTKLIAIGDLRKAEAMAEYSLTRNQSQAGTKHIAASDAYLIGLLKEIEGDPKDAIKYYQRAGQMDQYNTVYSERIDQINENWAQEKTNYKSAETGAQEVVNKPLNFKIHTPRITGVISK